MWWLVIRIIWSLLPAIINAVKEQRVKRRTEEEIITSLRKRIEKAKQADIPDEATDKYNRDNRP